MRLLIAPFILGLLFSACDGSSPSLTPPATPALSLSPTFAESASPLHTCGASDLSAAFTNPNGAAAHHYYTFGITNLSSSACTLPGSPALLFLAGDNSTMTVPLTSGPRCAVSAQPDCIWQFPDQIEPGQPTPAFSLAMGSSGTSSQPGQVSLTLIVPEKGLIQDCTAPTPAAIALSFPALDRYLDALIPQDLASQDCWSNVEERSFGPSSANYPTTSARTCSLADLAAGFLDTQGAAGTAYADFTVSNVSQGDCSVPGPPTLRIEDDAANTIGADSNDFDLCDGQSSPCVQSGSVILPTDGPAPGAPLEPGEADIALTFRTAVALVPPCASPLVQAKVLVVQFTGVDGELRIPFGGPEEIDLGPCPPQFGLIGWP